MPMVIRWPGTIQPGTVYNEMFSHYDLIPTFAAAGGDPDIVGKVPEGRADRRQDLQGPSRRLQSHAVLQGRGEGVAAQGVHLLERRRSAGGDPRRGLEVGVPGAEQHRASASGRASSPSLRVPKLFNLRADPFERGDESSSTTSGWRIAPSCRCRCRPVAAQWLASFKEFPVRQKPASFNLDEVMEKFSAGTK